MVKRTGPTNLHLRQLVENLRKSSLENKAPIWRDVAEKLSKPTRERIEVNLRDIERHTDTGETIVVPGIVLSSGDLSKKVNIAAWRFSAATKEKIKKVGGECLTIGQLADKNPKGSHIRIIS